MSFEATANAEQRTPDLGTERADPFSFAERDRTVELLGEAGWTEIVIEAVEEQMWLGTDAGGVVALSPGPGSLAACWSRWTMPRRRKLPNAVTCR